MGGMVNDMLSRLIYQHVVDLPEQQAKHELGIFGNIYRLAVLITIMIQAFRMAPNFFLTRVRRKCAPHLCKDHEILCDRLLLYVSFDQFIH
jgi:hypothetical protein